MKRSSGKPNSLHILKGKKKTNFYMEALQKKPLVQMTVETNLKALQLY